MKSYEKNHNSPIDEELHGWRSGELLHDWQLIIIITWLCLIVGEEGGIICEWKSLLKFLLWGHKKWTLRNFENIALKCRGGGRGRGVFNLMSGEASGFSADFNSKKFDLPYFQLRKV